MHAFSPSLLSWRKASQSACCDTGRHRVQRCAEQSTFFSQPVRIVSLCSLSDMALSSSCYALGLVNNRIIGTVHIRQSWPCRRALCCWNDLCKFYVDTAGRGRRRRGRGRRGRGCPRPNLHLYSTLPYPPSPPLPHLLASRPAKCRAWCCCHEVFFCEKNVS